MTDATEKPDIKALTGLRGVAALWVAAYHLLLPAHFATGLPARLLGRGYLAVDLFFVLSGFVMALNYGPWFAERFSPAAFARFLWRRFARLYPLYAAILVPRLIYTAARYGTFDLPGTWIASPAPNPALTIPANLALVQSWGIAPSLIGPAWSISVEWGVYFLFPALCLATGLARRRAPALLLLAFALIALVALADRTGFHEGLLDAWDGTTLAPLLRALAGFALGVACFLGRDLLRGRPRAAASLAILAALVLIGGAAGGAPDPVLYPCFPVLVLALAACPATPLAARLPVWLGDISYALYLLHIFALHPLDLTRLACRALLPPSLADLAAASLVFALLLLAADTCWRRIEMPARRGLRLVEGETITSAAGRRRSAAYPAPNP